MSKPPIIAPSAPFYPNSDLYIATVLVVSGFGLFNVTKKGNKAVYLFRPSDEINATISKYYSGELRLDPRQVFDVWKGLRSMAYRTVEDPG